MINMIVLILSQETIVNWVGLREALRLTPWFQHHPRCKSMPLNMAHNFIKIDVLFRGLTSQIYRSHSLGAKCNSQEIGLKM